MTNRTLIHLNEKDIRRFWAKVALPTDEGCMFWLAHRSGDGYGVFRLKSRLVKATRVSLHISVGEPQFEDAEAAHSCRNRHCVAPLHLRWATQVENQADRLSDGTHNRGDRAGLARLTWPAVRAIRSKAAQGISHRVLAVEYSVTPRHIRRIVRGQHWVEPDASAVTIRPLFGGVS